MTRMLLASNRLGVHREQISLWSQSEKQRRQLQTLARSDDNTVKQGCRSQRAAAPVDQNLAQPIIRVEKAHEKGGWLAGITDQRHLFTDHIGDGAKWGPWRLASWVMP